MMVRINLAPGQRKRKAADRDGQLIAVVVLLLVAELIAIGWLWMAHTDELEAAQAQLSNAEQTRDRNDAHLKRLPQLEAQKQSMRQRMEAVVALTTERKGPQHILDELRFVLNTPSDREGIKFAKEHNWNLTWRAENVFINHFFEDPDEPERVIIQGVALSHEDIAEFWLRLKSRPNFARVQLVFTELRAGQGPLSDLPLHHFEMRALANFRYRTRYGQTLHDRFEASLDSDNICAALEPDSDAAAQPPPPALNRP